MAKMASMLMRINRHASAASRAARLAAAAASRAARLAAADASPAARSATNAASLAAVAAAAARSAANAASRATRSDSGGPTHSRKRRDDSDEPFQGEYVPGKDVTYKDIESDEAIWALYERWCKAFNKERDHTEMARRFKKFKSTVHFLLDWNKAFREQCQLGEFADGKDEQEMDPPPVGVASENLSSD